MDEPPRASTGIFNLLMTLALIGGGIYFFQNYRIAGLDGVSIHERDENTGQGSLRDEDFTVSFPESTTLVSMRNKGDHATSEESADSTTAEGLFGGLFRSAKSSGQPSAATRRRNLRIGSWAMGGMEIASLRDDAVRQNVVGIAQGFDVLALQQIDSRQRDLVPRLVDAINAGNGRFDFVLGPPTGTRENPQQLAVIFDTTRVSIDRTQTYSVADPANVMTVDPLVVWFRTNGVKPSEAWTFSLVNLQVHLSRAAQEVAVLPSVFSSVRTDGRGEDDVVMAGLFQADDQYLIPSIMGPDVDAAIQNVTTDVFGKHQTCNVLVHRHRTTEYLGRGGTIDFLRRYNLSLEEAEAISPFLPVYADFSLTEGGQW